MPVKKRYTVEEKARAAERYLNGEASAQAIASEMGMPSSGRRSITEWAAIYRENGIEGFGSGDGNRSYTTEEKLQAVEEYLTGEGSTRAICRKHHIPATVTLRRWIKVYNSNRELRAYIPNPEGFVAMVKKTTQEERKQIVEYCLANGKNYKAAAAQFGASYSQVYHWVRDYEKDGDAGLEDRRGKRRSDDEVDDLEKMRRENVRLRAELEESRMLNQLLKKVKEYERS